MKVYKVEPTGNALADADEAFMWLYNEAPEAALRWYDGLMDALRSLERSRCGGDWRERNHFLRRKFGSASV